MQVSICGFMEMINGFVDFCNGIFEFVQIILEIGDVDILCFDKGEFGFVLERVLSSISEESDHWDKKLCEWIEPPLKELFGKAVAWLPVAAASVESCRYCFRSSGMTSNC